MSITNGRVMVSTLSPLNSISAVTFTRTAPLSNLTKASSKHATHWSISVPLTPLVPFSPLVPLVPGAPGDPCIPAGPCILVGLEHLFYYLCYLLSIYYLFHQI